MIRPFAIAVALVAPPALAELLDCRGSSGRGDATKRRHVVHVARLRAVAGVARHDAARVCHVFLKGGRDHVLRSHVPGLRTNMRDGAVRRACVLVARARHVPRVLRAAGRAIERAGRGRMQAHA